MAQTFNLPVLVQRLNGRIVIAGTRGAHGDAGWSVIACSDIDHAAEIMAAYPQARMRCWVRIEAKLIEAAYIPPVLRGAL